MSSSIKKRRTLSFSDIISILAIIFSLITFIYSARRDKTNDLQVKRKEVQDNLHSMIQLEATLKPKADSLGITVDQLIRNNWYAKEQIEVLLDNIDNVNSELPNRLSSAQYNHIGYCYEHYAYRAIKAVEYYVLALRNSTDVYDSTNSLYSLANFYYTSPFYRDINKAHQYISFDVDAFKKVKQNISCYYQVLDFSNFAVTEAYFNQGKAIQWIDSAKHYCKALLPDSVLYDFGVDIINANIRSINNNYKTLCDTLPKSKSIL